VQSHKILYITCHAKNTLRLHVVTITAEDCYDEQHNHKEAGLKQVSHDGKQSSNLEHKDRALEPI